MNYLERLRALENTKKTKKVCIYMETKEATGTKETKQTKELTEPEAACYSTAIGHTVAVPEAPLQAGWLVTYRDRSGRLCGGSLDRDHGSVATMEWTRGSWTVCLTDGQRLPLQAIRAVAKTDRCGTLLAAWTVKDHGYDG